MFIFERFFLFSSFNKKEKKFAEEYDKAIEELRQEGKIAELEQKYFGESLSAYIGDSDK